MSLGRKTPVAWPIGFSPFPSSQNPAAADAWFSEPRNQDFSAWEDAVGERPGDWKNLELCLETVTGLPAATVTSQLKDAVASVYDGISKKKHATAGQRGTIGDSASGALVAAMTVGWKGAAVAWLQTACRVAAPRFIHLWKKSTKAKEQGRKRKSTKAAVAGTSDEEEPDEVPDEARVMKKPKASHRPPAVPARRQTRPCPPPRSMGEAGHESTTKQQQPVARESGLSVCALQVQSFPMSLSHRRIQVRRLPDADAMDLDELDEPDTLVIAALACADGTTTWGGADECHVRDFKFDRFCTILRLGLDLREDNIILMYEEQRGSGLVSKQIRDEETFHRALVSLDWRAKDEEALEITLRVTS